jgi:hypothetical protein
MGTDAAGNVLGWIECTSLARQFPKRTTIDAARIVFQSCSAASYDFVARA